MEMRFSVGNGVTFGFSAGGSCQPGPQADEPPLSLNVMMIQGSYGQFFIPEFTPFGQAEAEEG